MKKEYKFCFYMIIFSILLLYSVYINVTKGYEYTIIPFFLSFFLGGISVFLLIVFFIFNKCNKR